MGLTNRSRSRQTAILISLLVVAVLLSAVWSGCASRYRLELFVSHQNQEKKVELEGTRFLRDVRMDDPLEPDRLVAASASVALATFGTRWSEEGRAEFAVFGWDEQLRCNLLLELPQTPQRDSFDLADRSVVQMLGHYDWPPRRRIFLPQSGYFTVDSVTSKHLFFTIDGRFQNSQAESLQLSGRFKVRAGQ